MKDKKVRQSGKGDRPRPFNYVEYCKNYDSIFHQTIRCCNCNIAIRRSQLEDFPDSYVFHQDGRVECKNCNFN